MSKQLLFKNKAREKLLKGINITADAVGSTLGPLGRNVAIENGSEVPHIYHDGVTVARSITLKDGFENMGAQLIKSAAVHTVDKVGDGTTTATILCREIVKKCFELIGSGLNAMVIKRDIERAMKEVIKQLNMFSKKIKNSADIENIARISSSDQEVGKIIAGAVYRIGKQGIIRVEHGKSFETIIEYKAGMEIDRGYVSPYFITDQTKVEAVIENPYILITDKKFQHNFEVSQFLDMIYKQKKNLFIIAGEVIEEALS